MPEILNRVVEENEVTPVQAANIQKRRLFGLKVKQRLDPQCPEFFVFYSSAKEIIKWSGIKRAQDHKDGTQRVFRKSRVTAVKRFFKSNAINTIPNNLLIAFDDGKTIFTSIDDQIRDLPDIGDIHNNFGEQIEWGFLEFEFDSNLTVDQGHLKIALIIDGQHRLFGMLDLEEDMPVLCVAILNATMTEQAFQFIVINNKAVRAETKNVKGIIADITQIETWLNPRLLAAGVPFGNSSPELLQIDSDEDSPFKKLLDWTANETENKLVPLTAIEQILSSLKKYFPKLSDDSDSLNQLIFSIWGAVADNYPDIWGKRNLLMTKVVLLSLNDYFIERLKFFNEFDIIDIFEPQQVREKVGEIISKIPLEFWTVPWIVKVQDNANMRELIKNDIEKVVNNNKNEIDWFKDLKLIKTLNDRIEPEEEIV